MNDKLESIMNQSDVSLNKLINNNIKGLDRDSSLRENAMLLQKIKLLNQGSQVDEHYVAFKLDLPELLIP